MRLLLRFLFLWGWITIVCDVSAQVTFATKGELKDPFENYGNVIRKLRTDFRPFLTGDTVLRLEGEKIDFRNLRPYYQYPNVRRLDRLCAAHFDFDNDEELPELQEIAFPYYDLVTIDSDTFPLLPNLYVLGNLRINAHGIHILLLQAYREAGGKTLVAIALDREGKILDIERICEDWGDGGGRYKTTLFYRDPSHYKLVELDKFQYYDRPVDSIIYQRNFGDIYIYPDGKMERYITLRESADTVRFKYRN